MWLKENASRKGSCLICHLKPKDNGYIQVNGKLLHRFVYSYYKGPIPEGLIVMHSCDNKRCIEEGHLIAGTHKQNSKDMSKKGRWVNQWSQWK